MKSHIASMIILALLAGGCASQLPLAGNHPISTQKKVRSAHHWDVIADDVADQALKVSSNKNQGFANRPIYVKALPDKSSFNKAFRNFLITRMVNRGIPVSATSEGALEIQYELQLVTHNSSRYTHTPGTITALTAGLWVLRDILGGDAAFAPSIGIAGLVDFGLGHYSGGPTHTELIVTTSIINDKTYALRKSDVYYIEEADADLFAEALERPKKQWQIVEK